MANFISTQSNANSNSKMRKGAEKNRFIKEAILGRYFPKIALEVAPTSTCYSHLFLFTAGGRISSSWQNESCYIPRVLGTGNL